MSGARTSQAERSRQAHLRDLRGIVRELSHDRRPGSVSSVTLKVSAQGVFMPEITIAANEDPATIDTMVGQAAKAYRELVEAAREGEDK